MSREPLKPDYDDEDFFESDIHGGALFVTTALTAIVTCIVLVIIARGMA